MATWSEHPLTVRPITGASSMCSNTKTSESSSAGFQAGPSPAVPLKAPFPHSVAPRKAPKIGLIRNCSAYKSTELYDDPTDKRNAVGPSGLSSLPPAASPTTPSPTPTRTPPPSHLLASAITITPWPPKPPPDHTGGGSSGGGEGGGGGAPRGLGLSVVLVVDVVVVVVAVVSLEAPGRKERRQW
ncbi:uncharacterized protein LOC143275050 [Babylonia areolata]|uniref:uncharacterized protein LOC143275050 n=1 Tax=Babylonia areolata TaxID=304850 RepID=UPI003FD2FD6F